MQSTTITFSLFFLFLAMPRLIYGKSTIRVQVEEKAFEVEKIVSKRGLDAVDFGPVARELGMKIYDPGLTYTASTRSSISFVDGPAGELLYRGYSIEQLIEKDYLEVAYLLIFGQLPSATELQEFNKQINRSAQLKPAAIKFISEFGSHADPMTLLPRFIMTLTDLYQNLNSESLKQHEKVSFIFLILGQIRSFIAKLYQLNIGQRVSTPDDKRNLDYELSYCDAFTQEAFRGSDLEEHLELASKALNMLLILHADHGQNCSTSTLRSVISAKASPFFGLNAAISALSGAAHGKANHDVVSLLRRIEKDLYTKQEIFGGAAEDYLKSTIDETLIKVKNKEMLLPGFGHRVYTSFDPRARLLKKVSYEVLESLGKNKSLLVIATALEQAALADPYFKNRMLYPNLDFYSGIIYTALDIPEDMLTLMFAFGRVSGWLSHYYEMSNEPSKIWRPGQVYIGK